MIFSTLLCAQLINLPHFTVPLIVDSTSNDLEDTSTSSKSCRTLTQKLPSVPCPCPPDHGLLPTLGASAHCMPFSRRFSFGQMKIKLGTLLTPPLTLSSKKNGALLYCVVLLYGVRKGARISYSCDGNPSCLMSRFALPPHENTAVTWDACFSAVPCPDAGRDARGAEALCGGVR